MPVALFVLLCVLSFGCGMTAADAIPLATGHLLFLAASAVFYVVGRGVTAVAPAASAGRFWLYFRRTLPVHPVIAGLVLGACFPGLLPESLGDSSGLTARAAGALYFGAAGVLSNHWHDIFRTWAKYRGQA